MELRTVFRRGKSAIPASRMEIDESSSERDERNEVTDAVREELGVEVAIFCAVVVVVLNSYAGALLTDVNKKAQTIVTCAQPHFNTSSRWK